MSHSYVHPDYPGWGAFHDNFSGEYVKLIDGSVYPPILVDSVSIVELQRRALSPGQDFPLPDTSMVVNIQFIRSFIGAWVRMEQIRLLEDLTDVEIYRKYVIVPWQEAR